jgi:hypothetical protein
LRAVVRAGVCQLLVGRDLGIEVNLIDGSLELGRESAGDLDPRDEALLKDVEVISASDKLRQARSEYLSSISKIYVPHITREI